MGFNIEFSDPCKFQILVTGLIRGYNIGTPWYKAKSTCNAEYKIRHISPNSYWWFFVTFSDQMTLFKMSDQVSKNPIALQQIECQ